MHTILVNFQHFLPRNVKQESVLINCSTNQHKFWAHPLSMGQCTSHDWLELHTSIGHLYWPQDGMVTISSGEEELHSKGPEVSVWIVLVLDFDHIL